METLREEIRRVDEDILRHIATRFDLARQIAEQKRKHGLSLRDLVVEGEVKVRNIRYAHELGLPKCFVRELTDLLLKFSLEAQEEYLELSNNTEIHSNL